MNIYIKTLVCLAAMMLLIAPSCAQPTSFVVNGWVFYENGTACDKPAVNITNAGAEWQAETAPDSSYYQIACRSGTDLNESDTLWFDVTSPDGSQSSVTARIVNQTDVDAGGFFEYNITLASAITPTITSCNASGAETNRFALGENVYVRGSGLSPNTNYTLWIQDDPVCEGYALCATNATYGDGANVTVQTGADGSFEPTLLWDIPSDATPTHHEYDIVADKQDGGTNTSKYNTASDGIDSASVAGIIAPVPELSSIALFAVGLVMLIGLVRFRRGK
jgi:hypothetical protein